MNRTLRLALLLALAAAPALAAPLPISTDGSDPKSWDPKSDGPIAAPANHKVVWENADIRIISVTVAPGETEAAHAHLRCAVLVWDRPTAVKDQDKSGRPTLAKPWMGELPWPGSQVPKTVPLVKVQPPEAAHAITNAGKSTLHLTRIEFKNGCAAPPR
jgi:hypothetical protein